MEKQKQKRSKLTRFLRTEDGPYKKLFYTYPEALFLIDTNGMIIEINQCVSTLTEYEPIEMIGKNYTELIESEDLASVVEHFQCVLKGEHKHHTLRIQQKSSKVKYRVEDMIGTDAFTYIHPGDLEQVKEAFAKVLDQPATSVKVELRLKTADDRWLETESIVSIYLESPNINGVVVNFRDVTENKKIQREIEYLAFHDHLTGMYNRKYFEKRLMQEVELANDSEDEFAVFIIDLDGFKFINDTLGHDIGDRLLCEVSKRVLTELDGVEVLARLGGDEFGLLQLGIKDEAEIKKIGLPASELVCSLMVGVVCIN